MYLLVSEDKAMKYLSPVGPEYHKNFPKCAGKAAEACNLFNMLKVIFCVYRQEKTPPSFQKDNKCRKL